MHSDGYPHKYQSEEQAPEPEKKNVLPEHKVLADKCLAEQKTTDDYDLVKSIDSTTTTEKKKKLLPEHKVPPDKTVDNESLDSTTATEEKNNLLPQHNVPADKKTTDDSLLEKSVFDDPSADKSIDEKQQENYAVAWCQECEQEQHHDLLFGPLECTSCERQVLKQWFCSGCRIMMCPDCKREEDRDDGPGVSSAKRPWALDY